MKTIHEPARNVPVIRKADVVVVGGGTSGICAALSAARNGARTLLIEQGGFLGGNAATWLPLLAFMDVHGNHVIKGIPQEIVDRLRALGAATPHYPCVLHQSYTMYDPEALKLVAQQMLLEAGVDILLHTFASQVLATDGVIRALLVDSKSGRGAVIGTNYVDCTGDGDLAAWAGAPFEVGDSQGALQPATLIFTLRNVDVDKARRAIVESPDRYPIWHMPLSQYSERDHFMAVGFEQVVSQARAEGRFLVPQDRIIFTTLPKPGEVSINMTRVRGIDGTSVEDLTRAELTARSQIEPILGLLRHDVPGFENAILASSAHHVGIRETRRIMGDYVLNGEDVLDGVRFPDEVMLSGYMVDIHNPYDDQCTIMLPRGAVGIPYRCLLPLKVENLLVAGRSISSTHEAQGAVRVQPPCMAMGEAAGCAAALASASRVTPRQVDVGLLRERLRTQGVCLDT